jgi:hypothetical protein
MWAMILGALGSGKWRGIQDGVGPVFARYDRVCYDTAPTGRLRDDAKLRVRA